MTDDRKSVTNTTTPRKDALRAAPFVAPVTALLVWWVVATSVLAFVPPVLAVGYAASLLIGQQMRFRKSDHERHVDIQFLKEKGRFPHDDEERRRWCIAKNLEQQVRGR